VLATESCANEHLDFNIKGWIIRVTTLEEQLTFAMFAVHGSSAP
jgi:hypothetical protein